VSFIQSAMQTWMHSFSLLFFQCLHAHTMIHASIHARVAYKFAHIMHIVHWHKFMPANIENVYARQNYLFKSTYPLWGRRPGKEW
jgi:hypothetical protein